MALAPALDLRPPAAIAAGQSSRPWWGEPPKDEETPPASVEAEQALLGAMLYGPEFHKFIAVELLPEHFYEPFHGRMWRAICETIRAGDRPDPTFLAEEFRRDVAYNELGGMRYLADLVDQAPPALRAGDYAAHLIDLYNKRQIIELANEMARSARAGHTGSIAIMAGAQVEMDKLRVGAAEPGAFINARQAAVAALEEISEESVSGRPRGAQTGLRCFDTRLGGLIPKRLTTIGGRPGMGKTALLRASMYGAATYNPHRTFAIFSLETPNREMSERAISAGTLRGMDAFEARESGYVPVQYAVLSRSNVGLTEMADLEHAAGALPENLFLFDIPRLGLADVRHTVWALKARGDLGAIGIDYVQLMSRGPSHGRNDAALIGDITGGLKQLAMEADISVVLVSQLSRGVDSRDDKRPQLSDLRESGSIEQDSDAVMFPYRAAYYLERAEPQGAKTSAEYREWEMKLADVLDLMEVGTAKLRQGRIGTDKQTYLAAYDAVTEWRKD